MANNTWSRRPLPDDVLRATVDALNACGGDRPLTARKLGILYETLTYRLRSAKARGLMVPPSKTTPVPRLNLKADASKVAILEKRLEEFTRARVVKPRPAKIGKEDWVRVIRPDLHGCNQDPAAVAAYLGAVKRLDPDEVVGLGDLTDCGAFLSEKHTLGYVAETAYSVGEDVAAVNAFLDAEIAASPRAKRYEIEGNHDHRIEQWCVTTAQRNGGNVQDMAKWLMSRFSPAVLYDFKRRGIDYVTRGADPRPGTKEPGTLRLGECLYAHGNFVGENACRQALTAYGTNVVFGHTHRMMSYIKHVSAHGTIGAWTCGFLAKRQPYWHHASPSGWVQGFAAQLVARSGLFQHVNVVIHDGKALLFGVR